MDVHVLLAGLNNTTSEIININETNDQLISENCVSDLSLLIFSGGSAFNDVAESLSSILDKVTYVLPVSDDGGSSAEIIRTLGGPAIGDIRSRCLRLSSKKNEEEMAVVRLLGYRLPKTDNNMAKLEWFSIVEGHHELWEGISTPYKSTIRTFLVHFLTVALQKNPNFRYANGSIGNFFFSGARMIFQSIEAAIFMYSKISGIPVESKVLPIVVDFENRLALGCELQNGEIIRGQNSISHPETDEANVVSKLGFSPLPDKVKRVFYLPTEGEHLDNEIYPEVNGAVINALQQTDKLVYGIGSLYTSIIPCLILDGVAETIEKTPYVHKILLLNGSFDRETLGMTATDVVIAITNALNRKNFRFPKREPCSPSAYIDLLVYPRNTEIPLDKHEIEGLGINLVPLDSDVDCNGSVVFNTGKLARFLAL